MTPLRWLASVIAICLIGLSIWKLEAARGGLDLRSGTVGTTPVTIYSRADLRQAPAVVIAHGFAGSRQLMEAYALTLAQAGFVAISFDFEGHGRNPVPMSGDVTKIEGTTQRLMDEVGRVTDYALSLPRVDGRVALLGHSMASDVIVRQTLADPRIRSTVAVSMFSQAVTKSAPERLLSITGEWEPMLRAEALRVLQLVDPSAQEGQTAQSGDVLRRAVVAPGVEHVGVLYSRTGLVAAREWLSGTLGYETPVREPVLIGPWIIGLLTGLVLLAFPLSSVLRPSAPPSHLSGRSFLAATLIPALATPLLLMPFDTAVLPVLVADYIALHLLVYGMLALGILRKSGYRIGGMSWPALAFILVLGLGGIGLSLDRYVASFVPNSGRVWIILAIAVGAIPFMVADTALTDAGTSAFWRRASARVAFFASLGLAIALDFERLFFLVIILPVILLYFLVFGTVGRWVGQRCRSVLAVGTGLGLILAWALGVTFPLFQSV